MLIKFAILFIGISIGVFINDFYWIKNNANILYWYYETGIVHGRIFERNDR